MDDKTSSKKQDSPCIDAVVDARAVITQNNIGKPVAAIGRDTRELRSFTKKLQLRSQDISRMDALKPQSEISVIIYRASTLFRKFL